MITPSRLKKEDKIAIVSPSEPILDRNRYVKGIKALKDFGFNIIEAPNALGENFYFDAEKRIIEINSRVVK